MAPPPSNRRTSTRQARTSTTRPTNYYARSFGPRGNADTPPANTAPGFCPAITHFTDSVAALPKELIRHFSMLKEVEAKSHEPEKHIHAIFEEVARMPVLNRSQGFKNKPPSVDGTGPNSAAPSIAGSVHQDLLTLHQELFPENFANLPVEEQASLRRRQVFFQLRQAISGMLPTLDEKIHVLSSATQTVTKGLVRMNSSYKYLGDEISEEARFGSTNHWAFIDKEEKKKTTVVNERARREVAASHLAAAAAAMQESEAAARSEARRDAMNANKKHRHQQIDSDFDDRPPPKKLQTGQKSRKAADAAEGRANGLGISGANVPVPKRRKVEKPPPAASIPMERSMSGAIKTAAVTRGGNSPRETPAAEASKKRKPPPTSAPVKKKVPNIAASSPMPSPAVASFKELSNNERAVSTRGRRGSTPPSAVSNGDVQRGRQSPIPHIEEFKPLIPTVPKNDALARTKETDSGPTQRTSNTQPSSPALEATPGEAIPMARSRSTRNKEKTNGGSHTSSESNAPSAATAKKSHKKRASVASTMAQIIAPAPPSPTMREPEGSDDEPGPSSPGGELSEMEVDEEGDEPLYCYCNRVSFGPMIGCDNDECPRGWFHWECVGIKKAPSEKTSWYCDECREAVKKSRPGSRA